MKPDVFSLLILYKFQVTYRVLDDFVEHCFSSDYEKWDSSDLSEKETGNWRFDRGHFLQGLNPGANDHEHDATSDANNEDALNLIMRLKE